MKYGVLLPHTKLFGGIKRFLELGNIFIADGIDFTVYTPDGIAPDWFDFKGKVKTFQELNQEKLDVLFCAEAQFIDLFLTVKAVKKVFYFIKLNEPLGKLIKHPNVELFACSSNAYDYCKRKYGVEPFKAIGGVGFVNYKAKESYHVSPDRPFYVMAYGRLSRAKGTMSVVHACEVLYRKGYNIKLLLFDTPNNAKNNQRLEQFKAKVPYEYILNHPFEKNSDLFNRADLFVSAERTAGWSNTVAEAMACAIPVVATSAGTKDLLVDGKTGLHTYRYSFFIWRKIKKLIDDEALRMKLGKEGRKHVSQYDWKILAKQIEEHFL